MSLFNPLKKKKEPKKNASPASEPPKERNVQEILQQLMQDVFRKNLEYLKEDHVDTPQMNQLFEDQTAFVVHKIGDVAFPTGKVVIGDPLCYLGTAYSSTLARTIPAGRYPVYLSIINHEYLGTRYLAAKLQITPHQAVRYEMAMPEGHDISELGKPGVWAGFGVDTGLGCFCDKTTEQAYEQFLSQWHEAHPDGNHYDDYFAALFAQSYQNDPNYQRPDGDYLDWTVPESQNNIVMFTSGFGDGFYTAYWGLDSVDCPCCLVIRLIDPRAFDIHLPADLPRRKRYVPVPGGIQKLIDSAAGCLATDRITVDGCKVDYMYREPPNFDGDSGWRFFGGGETQEYLDDPSNSGIYALNTIANYDPDIIPLLNSPAGTSFGRGSDGKFHQEA